jgi:tryptophan synthase alpha chain
MMNGIKHIEDTFSTGKAFIGYLTAGDGGIKRSLDAALALIAGGVNILEIGVPFSDPIADGPVIQRAAQRALASGTHLKDILWLAENIRKHSTIPLILFSYLNPILAALNSDFFRDAAVAGMDGVLIVDCPVEESAIFHEKCLRNNLAPIQIIAPSTPPQRIRDIAQYGQGFLYYACRKGTTGIRSGLPENFVAKISALKSQVHLPVIAGFGIADHATAQKVLEHADGVVIASLFVKALEDGLCFDELIRLTQSVNPLITKKEVIKP